jgi:hypothetical protein
MAMVVRRQNNWDKLSAERRGPLSVLVVLTWNTEKSERDKAERPQGVGASRSALGKTAGIDL